MNDHKRLLTQTLSNKKMGLLPLDEGCGSPWRIYKIHRLDIHMDAHDALFTCRASINALDSIITRRHAEKESMTLS